MDRTQINEAVQELQTLLDLLRWGASRFNEAGVYFGHGTDNAWDEALAIALSALNLPFDAKPEIVNSRLTISERRKIVELFSLRINSRMPAAYITHQSWFAGLPFYVDNRVLIPRSPTAELIENEFKPWIENHQVNKILDLCTGSGCIGIACAMYFPQADVDLVELSDAALAVARMNIEKHQMADQVKAIKSDLFSAIKGEVYDVIITNPPYVDDEGMNDLPAEYKHEPKQALAAGSDGLDVIHRILLEAKDHLSEHGILIAEVGNSEQALINAYPDMPFYWLEFTRGDDGVFLLTKEQLEQYYSH